MTTLKRSLILIPTWLLYMSLMFWVILCEVAGTDYYFGMTMPLDAIAAGMDGAIYFAPWLAIPILIRWKFGQVSWGTFTVYSVLLGTAFILQATRQRILENHVLNELLFALALCCFGAMVYFMYEYVRHMRAILAEARKPKGKKTRR